MKIENMTLDFLRLRILSLSQFLKMMALIIIGFSIYSCASLNSTNYQTRIRAVNKVKDQNILFKVALEDLMFEVKIAALNKITDQNLINRLAIESGDSNLRLEAVNKVTDQNILFKIASENTATKVNIAAFNKIKDQNLINNLAIGSNNSTLRLEAVDKVTDQNILFKVALEDRIIEVKIAAFNKITDQNLIGNLAIISIEPKLKILAINKVTDQNILFKIAIEDISYEGKVAAFDRITDQNLINRFSIESKESKLRLIAINKANDQNIIYKIALEDNNYEIKLAAMQRLSPGLLAKLANHYNKLDLKLKVVELLTDQTELMNISQNNDNWDVRKAAFKKLNDKSLDILSQKAKDRAVILSSKIRLGRLNWNEAFNSKGKLADIIGAAALVDTPQPTSSDVVSACHKFIQLGDASRIPELIYLLNTYGDVSLAEDYMNCGEKTLENAGCKWGQARGYECSTGSYGSNRVRWGSNR